MLDWILVGTIGAFIGAIVIGLILVLATTITPFTFGIVSVLSIIGIAVAVLGLSAEEVRDDD